MMHPGATSMPPGLSNLASTLGGVGSAFAVFPTASSTSDTLAAPGERGDSAQAAYPPLGADDGDFALAFGFMAGSSLDGHPAPYGHGAAASADASRGPDPRAGIGS
eukprot:411204-Rhodomonas_salina.1